jgi:translation initiation factor IF-2
MSENKAIRLSKIAREFNVGISTIVDFLQKKGHKVDPNPNTKIEADLYSLLLKEYSSDLDVKKKSESFSLQNLREKKEILSPEKTEEVPEPEEEAQLLIKDTSASHPDSEARKDRQIEEKQPKLTGPKVLGKVDLDSIGKKKTVKEDDKKEEKKAEKPVAKEEIPAKPEESIKEVKDEAVPSSGPKVVGKIDLETLKGKKKTQPKVEEKLEEKEAAPDKKPDEVKSTKDELPAEEKVKEEPTAVLTEDKPSEKADKNEMIPTVFERLSGPTVVGRIDLPTKPPRDTRKKPVASSSGPQESSSSKRKRKRIRKDSDTPVGNNQKAPIADDSKRDRAGGKKKKKLHRPEVNEEDVQKQVKDTLAKLTSKGKSKGSKYRRDKRDVFQQKKQAELEQQELDKSVIKVTEFVSVSELANMMDVPVNEIIQTCMNMGLFVSINQRLDAETLVMVADEFDFSVEFVSADVQDSFEEEEEDLPEELEPRPPIVTVMGHVDHGKTKLLDYIRNANVIGGEAGGITQHIGAYGVELEGGRKITFLDTPGHEAFTAMRARGAQITDIAIIVVAADDGVMPQTVEAINHASAAGVPIVFAINKVDKPTANPEKIKEELANMNYLVEDWGGKFQSQDISAKNGVAIEDLLEKVLLEAEMLELKANPSKRASGTVIESSLDRGRGYVATILVENGTLNIGDIVLAGHHFGHVKAMYNERGSRIETAGPSTPVLVLGLNGAPQAGDRFIKMESDREAKEIATKREKLQREQESRTQKHITLDEIGRRIAIGNFKELNLIVKGDVDGSVEALSDSLQKLSTEEIQVNIKHKAVGQISESDILLAAASNAIVLGFQVRPSLSARKIAEREQIDIRMYSIIYDAINEIKSAMEGMLSPEIKEEVTATLEILEVFKITKTGTIAGCMVKEGKIKRDSKVRIIRDGIVVYTGELGSLKRFKDDAKEVVSGLECGLNIQNFNDIKVGDNIEAFTETEIKKKL